MSACLGGEVQSYELNDNYEKAKETALLYKDIFKDGFYLEIQDHGMEEQKKVNEFNIRMSKETGIPLVATNDVHYIKREDSKSHDILMCIQTAKTVDDPNRRRYPSDQFYLKSPEEMWDMFSYVPEALENTVKIAEECNYRYKFHESKLPKFPLPEGEDDPYKYLRDTCYSGLIDRYAPFKELRNKELNYEEVNKIVENSSDAKEFVDRLEYELGVINQMGYVDYFLIVWDFIKFSYDNGIPTGPGRGCFLGDTQILMSNGSTKNIKDVQQGEEVITAFGNKSLVETLMKYDVEEEITVIEGANEEVKLTSDHKMLAVKTSPCIRKWKDTSKLPVICRKECSNKDKCIDAPFNAYKAEWIEASKLKENDLILYPRVKENHEEVTYDLLDYVKDDNCIKYDEKYIWYEIGTNKLETNKINRFIKLDNDLSKLYGYFIAEGWTHINLKCRTYKFGFGFNKKETDYVEDVQNLVEKIFGIQGNVYTHETKASTSIEFNSKVICEFLRSQCNKGANNKIIPYDVMLKASNEDLKSLISNMFRGDGSYSDKKCKSGSFRIKYTTTSIELTRQLRMALSRLGYWATFKTRVKQEEHMHDEYSVSVSGKQLLRWNDDFKDYQISIRTQKFYRNDSFYMDDDYFYIKIKSTRKEQYKGRVYDISVPGDTSYVANSMAVHNSAAGSIVAYTLGITKIDPIKYSLIFERFLNPERVSMPD